MEAAGRGQVLLVADETALPAVAGILEELAARVDPPRTLALLEVAQAGDAVRLKAPATAELVWLPRGQAVRTAAVAGGAGAAGRLERGRWRRTGGDRRRRADPLGAGRCRRGRAAVCLGGRRGGA
jgi:hypothetical protein